MHCNGCARKVHKHISKMEGIIANHSILLFRHSNVICPSN
jgi:copper chaperone CopZ